jgi:anti-sigma factor ChrR (cupin superfamily)
VQTQPTNGRTTPTEASTRDQMSTFGARRHPSPVVLAEFLLGQCSPGTQLLVSQHSARCQACWSRLSDLGGLDLHPKEPAPGPWTELPGGLQVAPLQGVSGIGEAVYVLRLAAGAQLSSHDPFEICELLITDGALVCDDVRYGAGDFLSIDDGLPVVIAADGEAGVSALFTTQDADATAGEA